MITAGAEYVNTTLSALQSVSSAKSTPRSRIVEITFGERSSLNPRVGKLTLLPEIRFLMEQIGLDETRLTGLRLEHKLMQSVVLRRFHADAFPNSLGLTEALSGFAGDDPATRLKDLFPKGFCIKPTLGAGSARGVVEASNLAVLQKIHSGEIATTPHSTILDEQWIVQAKLDILYEYRIHTLEGEIIDGLTFRYNNTDVGANKYKAQQFVSAVLKALPPGLIKDSFCGWDVALTRDGSFVVIEINYAGVHLVWSPAYQCSGLLQDGAKSPAAFAHLVEHVECYYQVEICLTTGVGCNERQKVYFEKVNWWVELLRVRRTVASLKEQAVAAYSTEDAARLMSSGQNATDRMYLRNLLALGHVTEDLMLTSEW